MVPFFFFTLNIPNLTVYFFLLSATDGLRFALNAINQVKLKLEGKLYPEENGVMAVRDQVNAVLHEAQQNENLAKMYEGWMAWI
jgi:phosphatidylinositol kinase/protein kinase (PI-3  family)